MSDFLPLFDGPVAEDPTYSVLELNNAISTALNAQFPGEIWVRGEIQGLGRTRMRKHWYFELVEKEIGGDGVRAKLSVALLGWNRGPVDRAIVANPGFDLDDGIEVRIRGRVGYYAPFGRLQFEMTGVDPAFTLGQMAINRERILRALSEEKLLDKNSRLELPPVPVTIGLVTSVGSAAYNDFVRELERGGFGHHVWAVDARVQGPETETTIVRALRTLARRRPDVVVLIRGGGSQSDLAGFDSERIARAVAHMPMPVFTGIGHEIDTSVADHVAHTAFKTPTACAAALVDMTLRFLDTADARWEEIRRLAENRLREESRRLSGASRDASRAAKTRVDARSRDLIEAQRRLRREAPRRLEQATTRVDRLAGEIRAGGRIAVVHRRERLHRAAERLGRERLAAWLERREERIARAAGRLRQTSPRRVGRDAERLDALAARVRALDPRRVLARGFSLTYDAQGRLLRSVAKLDPGATIRSRLVDGVVSSRVESANADPDPTFKSLPGDEFS